MVTHNCFRFFFPMFPAMVLPFFLVVFPLHTAHAWPCSVENTFEAASYVTTKDELNEKQKLGRMLPVTPQCVICVGFCIKLHVETGLLCWKSQSVFCPSLSPQWKVSSRLMFWAMCIVNMDSPVTGHSTQQIPSSSMEP